MIDHTPAGGWTHDVRTFKFKPRDVGLLPKQFGKSGLPLVPTEGVAIQDPLFQAAQLQHLVANAARESMLAEGYSLLWYMYRLGDMPGMTYERLVRIHRGETLMQLADLMALAQRFDAVRSLLSTMATGSGGRGADDHLPADRLK